MADLSPELEDLLRAELSTAQQCLPSTEAIEKLLNRVVPETDPVPDSEALDVVEEVMEFQEALEGVREALKRMAEFIGPPTITVHMLEAGLPLCEFSREPPGDWPVQHKWCHTVREFLTNVRAPEKPCVGCLAAFEKALRKPLRRCATCKKPFPDEYVGHNVTDTVWYCTPVCYRAAGGTWRE